jgi:hypothetical protein
VVILRRTSTMGFFSWPRSGRPTWAAPTYPLALALGLTAGGCSALFVTPPADDTVSTASAREVPDCTESVAAPALDFLAAMPPILIALSGVGSLASGGPDPSGECTFVCDASDAGNVALISALVAAPFIVSGSWGAYQTGRCREQHDALDSSVAAVGAQAQPPSARAVPASVVDHLASCDVGADEAVTARYQRAVADVRAGRGVAAVGELDALRFERRQAWVFAALGWAYWLTGDDSAAASAFRVALRLDPADPFIAEGLETVAPPRERSAD